MPYLSELPYHDEVRDMFARAKRRRLVFRCLLGGTIGLALLALPLIARAVVILAALFEALGHIGG